MPFSIRADLSEALAQSLAMTAIDQVSLGIIARRAAEGDAGAQIVQARQQAYLGAAAFAPHQPSHGSEYLLMGALPRL